MFTRNWYKLLGAFMGSTNSSFKNIKGTTVTSTSIQANCVTIAVSGDNYYLPSLYKLRTSLTKYGGVILGTGTTAPTLDDYKLSGDFITTFSYSSDVKKTIDDEVVVYETMYTITNTGAESFTIGEVALMMATNGSGEDYKMVIERTVLEEPVTIPAGGVGQVTYTIRMNYPTT